MSITVKVDGTNHHPHIDWPAAAGAWAAEVAPLARAALRARAPVGKGMDPKGPRPGGLRDSIKARHEHKTGVTSVVMYSTVPHAKFVLRGTRPHTISARYAKFLHWVNESGDHYAKTVQHPGTKPNPFPQRAIEPLKPILVERFAKAVREATRT